MTTQQPIDPALVERVLLHGDLRQLTPAQKVSYYKSVCESVGLNPLTQPFQYLVLNGKEILYANRSASEQLRSVHAVSIDPKNFTREVIEGIYVVTAPASLPSGRTDVSTGAVPIDGLKGEARANAMMKAETKAKRRVTLSICGLGMLDETEVASIHAEKPEVAYVVEAPVVIAASSSGRTPGLGPGDAGSSPAAAATDDGPDLGVDLPPGARLIVKVEPKVKGAEARITFNDGESYLTYKGQLASQAEQLCQTRTPILPDLKKSASGNFYLVGLTSVPKDFDPPQGTMPNGYSGEVPF